MHCKNCSHKLRTDYSFCPACGAKVIRNRITFKNLIYDVFERYFNLDNSFLTTIWHMLIYPQKVCHGYISGLRKKYLNPISMLAISLTLSGFVVFLMKKLAWSNLNFSSIEFVKTSGGASGTEKVMNAIMEYSSILFLLYIPVLAFASYLFFNKKKYNLPEHVVIATYALTTFSIISFLFSVAFLFVNPQLYLELSVYYSVVMLVYCIYVAYKNSVYKFSALLWRMPLFLLIFLFGYVGITILMFIVFFITGELSVSDFAPQ